MSSPTAFNEEAADFLRCSVQRIRNLVYEGKLPCYKDGTRSLFLYEDLVAYVEGTLPTSSIHGPSRVSSPRVRTAY